MPRPHSRRGIVVSSLNLIGADLGKEMKLTVSQLFGAIDLKHSGPVPWGTKVLEPNPGVYLIARVGNPESACDALSLRLDEKRLIGLEIDKQYEENRWLAAEPVLYIGKTDRTIQRRLREFYTHKCGDKSPHAGGQVIKLLSCDLWIYWAKSINPYDTEQKMLCAFRTKTGQVPFANKDTDRSKRIRRSA